MVEFAIAWAMSGALHMVAGGYICYRFRAQIDKGLAIVEPIAVAAWKKITGGK
jgi:hypothetical protein